MPYRRIDISPPFTVAVGDLFPIDYGARKVFQIRGGLVIAERTIALPGVLIGETPPAMEVGSFESVLYFEVPKMPGQNVSCTKVQENQTTGSVTFSFSSGNNIEYESWEAVGLVAESIDAEPAFAEKLLVAKAYRMSPEGANKTNQVGASVSVNGLADTPVVYTEPE